MQTKRYRDWQLVGKGGTAVVYRAVDVELGCTVAIKMLNEKHRANSELVKALRQEVLISRTLRHPNICPIHDIYEGANGFGIVMEYIDGCMLREWMDRNNARLLATARDRLTLLIKLTEALDIAHSHIVHRDLKPSNVYLRDGDIHRPLIMDFGISVAGTPGAGVLVGGTPKYMAPEQYEMPEKVDRRSDLFALGIMAYELMTGGRIPSCSLQHVQRTRRAPRVPLSQIPPPSEFCAIVPPALDRLVIQLLSYDQEDRPQSAAEVSQVLSHIELDSDALAGAGVGKIGGETVRVSGGDYYIGSGPDSEYPAEKPMRRVTLSPYEIGVTPATNRDYRSFLQATGYEAPPLIDHPIFGADDHPAVGVSWHDAMTYAKWAGGSIPTEAQWECAAKACERISAFPWGNSPPEVSQANIASVSDATTQVYSYPSGRNPLGLWDMCGNVWNWCLDSWDENYYRKIENGCVDPRSNGDSPLRSIRGGGYESFVTQGRCAFRHFGQANDRRPDVGFRIVYNDR